MASLTVGLRLSIGVNDVSCSATFQAAQQAVIAHFKLITKF
jgi:hypothetical protein